MLTVQQISLHVITAGVLVNVYTKYYRVKEGFWCIAVYCHNTHAGLQLLAKHHGWMSATIALE